MFKAMFEMIVGGILGGVAAFAFFETLAPILHLDHVATTLVGIFIGGATGEGVHRLRLRNQAGTSSTRTVSSSQAVNSQTTKHVQQAKPVPQTARKTPTKPMPAKSSSGPASPRQSLERLKQALLKGESAVMDLKGVELLQFAVDFAPQMPVDIKKLAFQLLQTAGGMPEGAPRDRLYDLATNLRDELPQYVHDGRMTSKAMYDLLNLFKLHHETAKHIQDTHMAIVRDGGVNDPLHILLGKTQDGQMDVHSVIRMETDNIKMAGADQGEYFSVPINSDGRLAIGLQHSEKSGE